MRRTLVAVMGGIGIMLGAATPAGAASGGAYATEPARIGEVSCIARCASIDAVQAGSLLRVRGSGMREVRSIVFLGARGASDDASARVLKSRVKSVDVVVPNGAGSGPLLAVNGDGARSGSSRAVVSVSRSGGRGGPLEMRVVGRQVFADAARPARVDLLARQPLTLVLALVRVIDGAIVTQWPLVLLPGAVQSVTWDGLVAGAAQPAGRYEFRAFTPLAPAAAQAAQAPPAAPLASGAFDLFDHKFPVRGKHDYGEGQAAFGAGRDGHSHQGHDVFARCGTPLVAARGGIVKLNKSHGAAGNYIVIDGEGTDVDYAYMHMRDRSPLARGARVRTGQAIGHVGDTGRAHGCHLHFEMWAAPGWYTGGQPFDPLPFLRAWDEFS